MAHEDSSIRRSLHSSIFILTLAAKKTQSKLPNPSWAVPQGSVFAIWWRGLSCRKISTSTSPDKVSLAGRNRLKQLLPPESPSGFPGYPDLHSCLWNLGNCGIKCCSSARPLTFQSLSPDPVGSRGQPVRPKNSLLELTLDFMHCISESITTKSPSQAIWRAAVRRRLWKMQVGGLEELDGSGFQSFMLMLFSVSSLRILKPNILYMLIKI